MGRQYKVMLNRKRPTKAKLDEIIETCIDSVNSGEPIEKRKMSSFAALIAKEILHVTKTTRRTRPEINLNNHRSPQNLLLDAEKFGLITKPEHKLFVIKTKLVIKIEGALSTLGHKYPDSKELMKDIKRKPLETRLNMLSLLSKVNFSEFMSSIAVLHDRIDGARCDKNLQKFKLLENLEEKKYAEFVSMLRRRIEARAVEPSIIERLKRASSPKKNLSKRELEFFLDAQLKLKPKPYKRKPRIK